MNSVNSRQVTSFSHCCYAAALNTRDTLFSRAAFDQEKNHLPRWNQLLSNNYQTLLNITKQHERSLKSAEVFSSTYGEEYRSGPCNRDLHGLTFTSARRGEFSQTWSMERERERDLYCRCLFCQHRIGCYWHTAWHEQGPTHACRSYNDIWSGQPLDWNCKLTFKEGK